MNIPGIISLPNQRIPKHNIMQAGVFAFLLMLLLGGARAIASASDSTHCRCLAAVHLDMCHIEDLFFCDTNHAEDLQAANDEVIDSQKVWPLTWRRRSHLSHRAKLLRDLKWELHVYKSNIMAEQQLIEKVVELAYVVHYNHVRQQNILSEVADQLLEMRAVDAIRFVNYISSDLREQISSPTDKWRSPYFDIIERDYLEVPSEREGRPFLQQYRHH
ncbi:uncharacterized protein LOC111070720 [Drosophila obscura]|uniref:uncharacterized protein LOC111070720 n=1 Tax=Drosophila obscura TaxID=7282 RepID=UPI001BB29EC6|nr:uncharacterized protein LOC111070720 [Drosophila obscura]